jgi:predicted nucleic acid-binding protein
VILVDSSIWIDHFRRRNAGLADLLEQGLVLCHPFVIGELACGQLKDRACVLDALGLLSCVPVASHVEALAFVDRHRLAGQGIGWIDVHLLAATVLAGGASLWTRDKRLARTAESLGLGYV